MHGMPPLNALRAFEASARHLSLTKAALELHVSPGAISHQLRGLEKLLRVKLFERGVRKIALTPAGKMLYPGVQTGIFSHRGRGGGPQASWQPAGPGRQHVTRTDIEMAGSEALPLRQCTSGH